MNNIRIISIFLGIAAAIVIFTFNKAGIMEGDNIFKEALKHRNAADSTSIPEQRNLIQSIDSTIAMINDELSNLIIKKHFDSGEVEKIDIDGQIEILNGKKIYLIYKKDEILNAYHNNLQGIKKETDRML